MSTTTRYICSYDRLPTIEAALAENGYHIAIPLQIVSDGSSAVVMDSADATVLLGFVSEVKTAVIEIWGANPQAARSILETLPIAWEPPHTY